MRTLTINAKVTIKLVARDSERSPDYRVTRAAKDTGAEYVSVKLDDPSFTAPITRPSSMATMASTGSSGRADRTR
jgi:uncharacterized protein (DUF736 family)